MPKPGGGINAYMEVLVKETVTLHKVLSRYLATPIVEVRLYLGVLMKGSEEIFLISNIYANFGLFFVVVRDDTSICCHQPQTLRGVRQYRASRPGGENAVRCSLPSRA